MGKGKIKKISIEIKVYEEEGIKGIEKKSRDFLRELGKQQKVASVYIKVERKKDLDELLDEATANAPSIKGYTIRDLPECIESSWSTTRRWPPRNPYDRRRTIRYQYSPVIPG